MDSYKETTCAGFENAGFPRAGNRLGARRDDCAPVRFSGQYTVKNPV
jgi:hypothetical protein